MTMSPYAIDTLLISIDVNTNRGLSYNPWAILFRPQPKSTIYT